MKTLILFIFSVFIFIHSGFAQVFPLLPKYYQPLDSTAVSSSRETNTPKDQTLMKQHEKVTYSMTVGTGFSSFGNNMSMMSSYMAPAVNYQINSKLNLSINGLIMKNNYNGLENFNNYSPSNAYNSNTSNYGVSGMAHYQLSEKWSIWGDGAYLENQSIFNNYHSEMYDTDYKTVSVGVGYKINEKFQFNFQYRYSNGLNPVYSRLNSFNNSVNTPYHPYNSIWGY